MEFWWNFSMLFSIPKMSVFWETFILIGPHFIERVVSQAVYVIFLFNIFLAGKKFAYVNFFFYWNFIFQRTFFSRKFLCSCWAWAHSGCHHRDGTGLHSRVPRMETIERSAVGETGLQLAASTVIRQFSNSFSIPFRSCQLYQNTYIYKGENTE